VHKDIFLSLHVQAILQIPLLKVPPSATCAGKAITLKDHIMPLISSHLLAKQGQNAPIEMRLTKCNGKKC